MNSQLQQSAWRCEFVLEIFKPVNKYFIHYFEALSFDSFDESHFRSQFMTVTWPLTTDRWNRLYMWRVRLCPYRPWVNGYTATRWLPLFFDSRRRRREGWGVGGGRVGKAKKLSPTTLYFPSMEHLPFHAMPSSLTCVAWLCVYCYQDVEAGLPLCVRSFVFPQRGLNREW